MSILGRLFGGSAAKGPQSFSIAGHGDFPLEVVSVLFYQENLERICGPRTDQGVDRTVRARLMPEEGNPHDPQAVRVEVDGRQVGYLNRDFARQFRRQIKQAGQPRAFGECDARITGGTRRKAGGRAGAYSVWLDIPAQ